MFHQNTVDISPGNINMSPAATASPKKAAKSSSTPKEPSSSDMVKAAITELADRKGSSLPAIKKYISAHYKVDIVKKAPFICKAIKAAVEKGVLVQTKGKGAAGTFKLAVKAKKPTAPSKEPKKPKSSPKKTSEKKSTKVKTPVKKSPKTKTVKAKTTTTPKKSPTKAKPKTPKKTVAKKPAAAKTSVKKVTTKKTGSKKA